MRSANPRGLPNIAGAKPKRIPVPTETATLNSRMRPSIPISNIPGSTCGLIASRARVATIASMQYAERAARTIERASSIRSAAGAPGGRASRTERRAHGHLRLAPHARQRKCVTFARLGSHAISRMSTAAPSKSRTDCRTLRPIATPSSGSASARRSELISRIPSASRRPDIAATSACARLQRHAGA